LLTYSSCVLAAGVAQCYSLAVFGNPQSTVDAFTFFAQISPEPPFATLDSLPPLNAPLAVVIWQQVYILAWWLRLDFGPHIAVMLNSLIMGLTAAVVVRTGRDLFGGDAWRLRRIGTLFAACGLFLLFGAVLIRDCFTTFLNTLVLWSAVRLLVHSRLRDLFLVGSLSVLSAYAMLFLRAQAVPFLALIAFVSVLCWFFSGRLNVVRLVFGLSVVLLVLIFAPSVTITAQAAKQLQADSLESYVEKATDSHSDQSLGMSLVVTQPMPVRLVFGIASLLISPIPLWAFFQLDSLDYDWFKGYNGLYQVVVVPLFATGVMVVLRAITRQRKRAIPFFFLLAYTTLAASAVALTSLEQRHLGQFVPAVIILAACPDTRCPATRRVYLKLSISWFVAVVLVNLAWVGLKGRS
ncbi:MAG: hypothetical protein IMZ50_04945, partial [Candidatus Atribacteria bacterium]|nr:hypothetical protein [Candidatus Atribacteria bacterium]